LFTIGERLLSALNFLRVKEIETGDSNHLPRRVAEQLAHPGIDERGYARRIDDPDPFGRGFHDTAIPFFAVPERLFQPFAIGNVLDESEISPHNACFGHIGHQRCGNVPSAHGRVRNQRFECLDLTP
jgi:hypothetical protein